jgi:hypothetical protein
MAGYPPLWILPPSMNIRAVPLVETPREAVDIVAPGSTLTVVVLVEPAPTKMPGYKMLVLVPVTVPPSPIVNVPVKLCISKLGLRLADAIVPPFATVTLPAPVNLIGELNVPSQYRVLPSGIAMIVMVTPVLDVVPVTLTLPVASAP